MAFDPNKYGATPVATSTGGFDPNKYGATPVQQSAPDVMPQTAQPAQEEPGFLKNLAMATGIPRLAANVTKVAQILTPGGGPVDTASPVNMPWLGPVKPVGQEGNFGEKLKDTFGESAKLASTVVPVGGGAVNVAKAGLAGKVGRGLVQGSQAGAVGGSLYGFGEGLQEEGASIGSVAKSTVLGGAFGGAGGAVIGTAAPLISRGISSAYRRATTPAQKRIQQEIIQEFEKGVKPNLPGKTTPTSRTKFNNQIAEGVEVINNNKVGLSFTDDAGEMVTGRAPKTLKEFSDAVEQTKTRVFGEYDNLATQAGEAGVKVDVLPIANELDEVINNKALQLSHPEAVAYAKQVQDRFRVAGPIDAKTTQEVIKNYNNSLQAFYRNPTPEGLTRNAVDAMMVNRIRKSLDEGIEGLTGAQYQALKNQYGALKAIERDVMRATLRDARRNIKGLIDYTDIFSGGQVVGGILSANPAAIASGLTQKAISSYFKFLNNPNRAIQKMFKAADKIDAPASVIPQSTRKGLPAGPARIPGEPGIRSSVSGGGVIPVAPKGSNVLYPGVKNQVGGDAGTNAPQFGVASKPLEIPQSNQVPANSLRATSPATNSATKNAIPTTKPQTPKKAIPATKEAVNNAKAEVDMMTDAVNNHPAKGLLKYTGRGNNSLAEIQKRAEGKLVRYPVKGQEKIEGKKKILGEPEAMKASRLDDIVDEAGYKDLDDAQAGIDDYMAMKEALADKKRSLAALRKEIQKGEDVATYDDPKYTGAEAFAGAPMGFEIDEETGELVFNEERALMFMAGIAGAQKLTPALRKKAIETVAKKLTPEQIGIARNIGQNNIYTKTGVRNAGTGELGLIQDLKRMGLEVPDEVVDVIGDKLPTKLRDFMRDLVDTAEKTGTQKQIPVNVATNTKHAGLRSKLKPNEILVKQKKTGKIGAIQEKDFNKATYERV